MLAETPPADFKPVCWNCKRTLPNLLATRPWSAKCPTCNRITSERPEHIRDDVLDFMRDVLEEQEKKR